MLWRGQNRLGFLPGSAKAQLTALLLGLAAAPVALMMALFTDIRALFLWLLMWPVTLMPRRWWRTVFLLALIPTMLTLLAQLARPPQAPYFMLVVLVLSVCEQVTEDGRPGAFNLIGVIFPALCVMVLSTNVFVFLLLLVAVIFYAGVYTLRINDMPLSGLRIRLLPIVLALSGSLFFAIAAFLLMPRINPAAIPGLVAPQASSGVGGRLDMGRFSDVILNGDDAFRAFVEKPLPQKDLYWRVHVLGLMDGASWTRDPRRDAQIGALAFDKTVGPVDKTVRYAIRHARQAPDWHPVLGIALAARIDDNARLNRYGEYVKRTPNSVLDQQVLVTSSLDDPYRASVPTGLQISGQPKLAAWARENFAQAGTRQKFIDRLLLHFASGDYQYTLRPDTLRGAPSGRLDRFFFDTKNGYCSHYAMAMATALRAAGIPAHVVVGYHGGEWNGFGQYYRIRQSDAHAWVEAEVRPGEWLRLDPTQVVPSAASRFRARQFEARNIETLAGWRGVMGRSLQRVDAFVVRLNSDIVLYDEQARRELLSGTVLGRLVSFVSFWLLASLAFIVPLFLWRWWVRRDPMLRLDQEFLALARKDGLARASYEGRMNFARRWAEEMPVLAEPVAQFAELFCRLTYGASHDADRDMARRELKNRLTLIKKLRRNMTLKRKG
jgi:transglutaminase-like putative cysteine protease